LAALPAFCLLVALGIAAIPRWDWRGITLAAVVGCGALSLANHYWNPRYGKEDVRTAVAYARSSGASGIPVITIGQIDRAVQYYGTDLRVVPITSCDIDAEGHDALRAAGLDSRSMWLVVGRDWERQAQRCRRRLAHTHAVVDRRQFSG